VTVDRLIAIAAGAVGQGERDPAFQALCGPGETPAMQRALAGKSTCALFLRGCLYEAIVSTPHVGWIAVPPPRISAPYVDQRAMADLVAVCEVRRSPKHDQIRNLGWRFDGLQPGWIVIVGAGNNLHAYLVESVERDGWPDGSIEVTAIEAGQELDGVQCALRKRHEIDSAGVDRIIGTQIRGEWLPDHPRMFARPVAYVLDPNPLFGES
jgi:hypothetical protein